MTRKVDDQVLEGFIEEANGYLPAIRDGIKAFQCDPAQAALLETAFRYMHTIKGAASMVGLEELSDGADQLEQIFADVIEGSLKLVDEDFELLIQAVTLLEEYLQQTSGSNPDEPPLKSDISLLCSQLRGLSVDTPMDNELAGQTGIQNAAPGFETPEEISQELFEVYSIEAEDHLKNISVQMSALQLDPSGRDALLEIRRTVHTLKGAAGAVGLGKVSELAHRMEDLLDQAYESTGSLSPAALELLFDSMDALEDLSTGTAGSAGMQSRLSEIYAAYDEQFEQSSGWTGADLGLFEDTAAPLTLDEAEVDEDREQQPLPETTDLSRSRFASEVMRVPLSRLDDLVRVVSELVINRTAFEQRMADFNRELEELQLSGERLRKVATKLDTDYGVSALGGRLALYGPQGEIKPGYAFQSVNPHGFDELEFDQYTEFHLLSRELLETTSDVRAVGHQLTTIVGDFESLLARQGRLSSDIQDKLMRTRMVPLTSITPRLQRAVRVIAKEQGKSVSFVLEGYNIELDKSVMDEIADPLLHLMRNAVDHGIEPPAMRQAAGKPEIGLIQVKAHQEGNQIVIRVSDDGAGMDLDAMRRAAVRGGFVPEAEAAQLTQEELFAKAFLPGFSTASEVSEVSGRGVGLDIVKTTVQKLKGSVRFESQRGKGTTFTIRLPMTMAVMQALLVRAHNETFAIPLSMINNILRLRLEDIDQIGDAPVLKIEERVYPLFWLSEVLNFSQPAVETQARMPVLILQLGDQSVGLVVDQLVGGREIVIKSLGSHLRHVHGIAGATLMGDGSVVLILNPGELLYESGATTVFEQRRSSPAPKGVDRRYSIMIVDDSLSVRRVLSNLIKSAGWQPLVAKDGVEALEMLQEVDQLPDLALVDIEMPRMDGYELMSTMKADDDFRTIPLVVLTSRAGAKHRRKAMAIGASDYIVKPYQDEEMLRTIRQRIKENQKVVSA